jgi:hypothetical protein
LPTATTSISVPVDVGNIHGNGSVPAVNAASSPALCH